MSDLSTQQPCMTCIFKIHPAKQDLASLSLPYLEGSSAEEVSVVIPM